MQWTLLSCSEIAPEITYAVDAGALVPQLACHLSALGVPSECHLHCISCTTGLRHIPMGSWDSLRGRVAVRRDARVRDVLLRRRVYVPGPVRLLASIGP